MDWKIKAIIEGRNSEQMINQKADTCPYCGHASSPREVGDAQITLKFGEDSKRLLEIPMQCPRNECSRLFIAVYKSGRFFDESKRNNFRYVGCVPISFQPKNFPEEIATLSPSFVEIYNQAAEAEARRLDQIAGPGYRKALEFLIKDFLIGVKKEDRESIENMFLGKCIKDHLGGSNLQSCAERAVWLGNDETHYVRKWETKDIDDLKALIKLTVHWIEAEILSSQYNAEMQK